MGSPPYPPTLSGFAVMPVIYSKDATHFMYAKAHSGVKKSKSSQAADKALPDGRTLFLVNVPPDATQRELVLFFKPAGAVEKVVFDQAAAELAMNQGGSEDEDEEGENEEEDDEMEVDGVGTSQKKGKGKKEKEQKPTLVPLPSPPVELRTLRKTGRTAYVVFLDASSLSSALTGPHKARRWPSSSEPRGLAHYTALHTAQRPPLDSVRAHAESAIVQWDWEEAAKKHKSRYKKGEAIVDEDGFTLVVRGGAYGKTLGGEVGVATRQFERTGQTTTARRKKEKKEKEGFYGFQRHEKKRQELIDLKKKWNEDLAKVEKLKHSRRFKPY